ncbi:MAG: hypothetical protein ACP5J4_12455 [Anaerolineae bacterium]
MRRQVRPALVIGVGAPGVHVAAEVMHLVHVDLSDVPVVGAVACGDATVPRPATVAHFHRLYKEDACFRLTKTEEGCAAHVEGGEDLPLRSVLGRALDGLYRVDAVSTARALGWEIRRAEGGIVVLVIAQDALVSVLPILTALQTVIVQQPARRLAVIGVLLAAAGDGGASDGGASSNLAEFTTALSTHCPCVEGLYTVTPTNVVGLTAASDAVWERMIAQWIVEMVATPLGASVAATPLEASVADTGETLPYPGGFGLSRWRFPSHALETWLSWKLQRDMLAHLLGPGGEVDVAVLASIRDRCSQPSVLPELPPTDFAAARPLWTHPDLRWIHDLRTEIDTTAETMLAQAEALIKTWAGVQDQALLKATQALDTELAAWLATPQAGCLLQILDLLSAIQQAFLNIVRTAETAAQEQERQHSHHLQVLETLGATLTSTLQRFPAWSLRAWWRIVRRPWRWLPTVKRYREIVRLAQAYAACYESLWLATLRACEARWRASFAQMLASNVGERLAALRPTVAALAARRDALTAELAATEKLDRLLARAALPPRLKTHYYTRNVATMDGEIRAAFVASGGLWAYLYPDPRLDSLLDTLADHAFERFAFLQTVRLDEVLVRTYSGAELRTRLHELVETAAPFLSRIAGDDAAANGFLKRTWIGLPIAEEAQLVDLLPDRGIEYYSTGAPGIITVTQMWWQRPPLILPPLGGARGGR